MDPLFRVHRLNEAGLKKADSIAQSFDALLLTLRSICPDSREFSIAKDNLEQACFFAKKSIANDPQNQQL